MPRAEDSAGVASLRPPYGVSDPSGARRGSPTPPSLRPKVSFHGKGLRGPAFDFATIA